MSLALIVALCLSVVAFTFAFICFKMAVRDQQTAKEALVGWKMAEYQARLSAALLSQCHMVNQELRARLHDDEDEGEAWKRQ